MNDHDQQQQARESILARLRPKARESAPPAPWRSRRTSPDLAAQFEEALTAAGGEVVRAGNLDGALSALADLLHNEEARRVVANTTSPLETIDLSGRFPAVAWHLASDDEDGESWRAHCAAADLGLSGADAALAETGSIIISSGPGRSRLATLLPPVHVALVPVLRLTADIFTWAAARQRDYPANLTLVSGPSKTADIEQTLAVGVHGPKRLVVILYE